MLAWFGAKSAVRFCLSGSASGAKPFTGAALGFGDFARGHFVGNFSAAQGGFFVATDGGKIEPLVCLDQIAGNAVTAGGIDNAQIEECIAIAIGSGCKAGSDQQVSGFG